LENVRLVKQTGYSSSGFDWKGADESYRQTFQSAGLEIDTVSVEEAAEHIRKSTIAVELAAILDQWSMVRRNARAKGDTSWTQLLHVARLADSDPERTKLRVALQGRDLQALQAAAASEEVFRLPVATLCVLGYALVGDKENLGQAEAFLRNAQRRYPGDFWLNHILFICCKTKRPSQPEDAVRFAALAVGLRPTSVDAHFDLGSALQDSGKLDEAIAEFREVIAISKDLAEAHKYIGNILQAQGKLDPAIEEFRQSIAINNNDSDAHNNLAVALRSKGLLEQAKKECEIALKIAPNNHHAHNDLGIILQDMGQLDEAIVEYLQAVLLNDSFPEFHNNLGAALTFKDRLDEAVVELYKVVKERPGFPAAHLNLGIALARKEKLNEALKEFQMAIWLDKDIAEAHCSLGYFLMQTGQFRQAVEEMRLGCDLGSRKPQWPYAARAAQILRDAEHLADLDGKLPHLSKGETKPANAAECLDIAKLCQLRCKSLFVASARFYAEAFLAQPDLADDLRLPHRYNAAWAAALVGCGQGKDADQSDNKERARLRRQSFDWLRADLAAWRHVLDKEPEKIRPVVLKTMQHWQQDKDFAGVRDSAALTKLPEAERQEWQKLWAEVDQLRQEAAKPAK